jgi:urease accessory protein
VMARDAARMRGDGPVVFAQVAHGVAVPDIAEHALHALRHATGPW